MGNLLITDFCYIKNRRCEWACGPLWLSVDILCKQWTKRICSPLSWVYTSGFLMHLPHCIAIFYNLPWFWSIKVSNKKSQRNAENTCKNQMCKRAFRNNPELSEKTKSLKNLRKMMNYYIHRNVCFVSKLVTVPMLVLSGNLIWKKFLEFIE